MVKVRVPKGITHSHGYKLIDGVERNKAHPDTFDIPDEQCRENLFEGCWAKVGFEHDDPDAQEGPGGERMWVKISGMVDGVYVGNLDNEPAFLHNIKYRDEVRFEPKHVLSFLDPNGN